MDSVELAVTTSSEIDALDFYKSITQDNRVLESSIISNALEFSVVPEVVRYDYFKDNYRGVIKSTAGEFYYFNMTKGGNFHLVVADDDTKRWEANKLLKSCNLGMDLVKASEEDEDESKDHEDEEKAVPSGVPASVKEDVNVATQDSQITEVHPGAAGTQTAQQDGGTERWHGSPNLERALPELDHSVNPHAWDTIALMKSWGQHLQATAPQQAPAVDRKMQQFMVEILGKTPSEAAAGNPKLSPMQRAQYNQWLTKSLRGRISALSGWLEKIK